MPEETIRIVTYNPPEAEPEQESIDGSKDLGTGATFLDIEVPEETHPPDGTKGPVRVSEVSVETLEREMGRLIDVVERLVNRAPDRPKSGMQLEEIELSVEIDGRGKVSLVGSGLDMGAKGAVKLKFKRKSS